jgi:hypothetical protein
MIAMTKPPNKRIKVTPLARIRPLRAFGGRLDGWGNE